MSRMLKDITIQVARKTSEKIRNIKEILDIIPTEIQAREIGRKVRPSNARYEREATSNRTRAAGGTTRSFLSRAPNEKTRPPLRCYFCLGDILQQAVKKLPVWKKERKF